MNNGHVELQPFSVTTSPSSGVGRLGNDDPISVVWDVVQDVLDYKGRSSEIVDGAVKESLDFFVMQVHCDQVIHTCRYVQVKSGGGKMILYYSKRKTLNTIKTGVGGSI